MMHHDGANDVREVTATFRLVVESVFLTRDCHLPIQSSLSVGFKIDKSMSATRSFLFFRSLTNTNQAVEECLVNTTTLLLDRQPGTYRHKIGKLVLRTKINMYGRDTFKTLGWLPLYLHEIVRNNLDTQHHTYDFTTLHGVSVTFSIAATITRIREVPSEATETVASPAIYSTSPASIYRTVTTPQMVQLGLAEPLSAGAEAALVGIAANESAVPNSADSLQSPSRRFSQLASPIAHDSAHATTDITYTVASSLTADSLDGLADTPKSQLNMDHAPLPPPVDCTPQDLICHDEPPHPVHCAVEHEQWLATAETDHPVELTTREDRCFTDLAADTQLSTGSTTAAADTSDRPQDATTSTDGWVEVSILQYLELAEENKSLVDSLIQVKVSVHLCTNVFVI